MQTFGIRLRNLVAIYCSRKILNNIKIPLCNSVCVNLVSNRSLNISKEESLNKTPMNITQCPMTTRIQSEKTPQITGESRRVFT